MRIVLAGLAGTRSHPLRSLIFVRFFWVIVIHHCSSNLLVQVTGLSLDSRGLTFGIYRPIAIILIDSNRSLFRMGSSTPNRFLWRRSLHWSFSESLFREGFNWKYSHSKWHFCCCQKASFSSSYIKSCTQPIITCQCNDNCTDCKHTDCKHTVE